MHLILVGTLTFVLGILFSTSFIDPKQKECPETKQEERVTDIAYTKALEHCVSKTEMRDYECIRFLNGGRREPKPTASPSPTPRPYKAYRVYKPKDEEITESEE